MDLQRIKTFATYDAKSFAGADRAFHATHVAASDRGKRQEIRVWSLETGKQVAVLKGHQKEPSAIAISPKADYVAAACRKDNTVRIWNVKTAKLTETVGFSRGPTRVQFSPNGRWLAVGFAGEVAILNALTGQPVTWLKSGPGAIMALEYSRDGSLLAASNVAQDALVTVWRITETKAPPAKAEAAGGKK